MNAPVMGGNIAPDLNSIVGRIEKLTEEKAAIQADIREVFFEAKGRGLDSRTIREVLKLRKLDASDRDEREHLRDVYLTAMGLLAPIE